MSVVNGLGEVFVAVRNGDKIILGGGSGDNASQREMSFVIDSKYKPPIPKVVIAVTDNAEFHVTKRSEIFGGCCLDHGKCDFKHFCSAIEQFIVPALAKAITQR